MHHTPSTYDVFLSYHWQDFPAVDALAHALRTRGLNVFFDRWYLAPGQSWVHTLEQTLNACRAAIIFIGPFGMGRWQQRERDLALDRQARESFFPVIPAILPGGDPALGFLSLNTWVDLRDDTTRELSIEILLGAVRGTPPGPELRDRIHATLASICPYRGLRPFREEDASFFCGREEFTQSLTEIIAQKTLVAVVGASGSGKSSVVRAGLIPNLRRDVGGRVWEAITMVPLDRPLHGLAAAFMPLLEPEMGEVDRLAEVGKLAAYLRDGVVSLTDLAHRALEKQPGTDRLLLFVDQWEELYTLCRDELARQKFLDAVLEASADRNLFVVLTLRGDFYGHVLSDRRMADRMREAVVNLGPMKSSELRRSMEEPAQKVGLTFEPGLVNLLLSDLEQEPGNLPLLEFVLSMLWERRQGGQLLHAAYEALGGVKGAITRRADEVFSALKAGQQETAHRVMIQLVRPGEGTADTRKRACLVDLGPAARSVIQALANERLLVTSQDRTTGEEVVEITHEALIRNWARLRQWIEDDREFLRTQMRIESAASYWVQQGKIEDFLLPHGRPLAEAEDLLEKRRQDLSSPIIEFIEASIKSELDRVEVERKKREAEQQAERSRLQEQARAARRLFVRTMAGLVLAVCLVVVIGILYKNLLKRSAEATKHFRIALSVVDALVTNVASNFRNVSGFSSEKAKLILTEAERIVDEISVEAGESRDLQIRKIKTLNEFAETFRTMGDWAATEARAQKALDLLKTLDPGQTSEPSLAREFVHSHEIFGDSQWDYSRFDKALDSYLSGRKLAQSWSARGDQASEWMYKIARLDRKIGSILSRKRNWSAAQKAFAEAESILQNGSESAMGWQQELAAVYDARGDLWSRQGDHISAFKAHEQAVTILQQLLNRNLVNSEIEQGLSISLQKRGDAQRAQNDWRSAVESYQSALDIINGLAEQDQRNITIQLNMALARQRMRNVQDAHRPSPSVNTTPDRNPDPDTAFHHGIDIFRFGMTPEEVNNLLPQQFSSVDYNDLPVASEYKAGEVRYFWKFLKDLPNIDLFYSHLPCVSKESYITFLFFDLHLFRISIRFINDSTCPNHQLVLDHFASRFRIPIMATASGRSFRFEGQNVSIFGVSQSFGIFIEFIRK